MLVCNVQGACFNFIVKVSSMPIEIDVRFLGCMILFVKQKVFLHSFYSEERETVISSLEVTFHFFTCISMLLIVKILVFNIIRCAWNRIREFIYSANL